MDRFEALIDLSLSLQEEEEREQEEEMHEEERGITSFSTFLRHERRMWRRGAYHNPCRECGGEDCQCCSFYHSGGKGDLQGHLDYLSNAIAQARGQENL